ncbi:phosphotransferase-like [Diplodia corticola]|uniref:2'-phosphotransferase n=1 Tax=Diplodia corticola TaxID=236234 RepID=A0A1J9QPD7_9PEZI|nr:phosphotransferase-like [Diplodia corticola]OJD29914.1 phosphotransferase-like [Diplodia corticola]
MSSPRGGSSRGGRGRGRGGGGALPREVQVSKKMSRILRHSAEAEGLTLGEGGYVSVRALLQTNTMKSLHVSFAELRAIVAANDKQRFSLIPVSETTPDSADSDDSDPARFLIRANQGHSMASVASEGLLAPLTAETDDDFPAMCVHGTTAAAWPAILAAGGLKPMGRNHVHLAPGLPRGFARIEDAAAEAEAEGEAPAAAAQGEGEGEVKDVVQPPPVISGMRNSSRVLVYVDLRKALAAGVPFWRSANGVILTEGDVEKGGVLGVEFFERVEDRKLGRVLNCGHPGRKCSPTASHTPEKIISTTEYLYNPEIMASKPELCGDFSADAAPQTAATLPRRTHRKSSPSLSSGESAAAVKPAAAATATATTPAHGDHSMGEASDAESDSSVVSTSSEEPSSESDEEDTPMDTEEITSLPLPPDAEARRRIYQRQAPPSSALGERLKAFLPQLAAANDELERDRAAGKLAAMSLENVGEGDESYIELNLGLGVLKDRDPNKMDSDSESNEDADADDEMDTGEDSQESREEDVLAKLMGKKKTKAGAGIQEVSGQ